MPLAITTELAKPQDFSSGRGNVPVDTLVLHTTEGESIRGAESWWDREDVVASAHYLVDGARVVARVCEGDTAFHAGNRAINRRSIGIEVVGHCGDPAMWTPAKLEQLAELSAEIVRRHAIPVVHQPGPGICGHADVPDPLHQGLRGGAGHHHDPGAFFPWDEYFARLRALIAHPEVLFA